MFGVFALNTTEPDKQNMIIKTHKELLVYIYIYTVCAKPTSKNSPSFFATFDSSTCQGSVSLQLLDPHTQMSKN